LAKISIRFLSTFRDVVGNDKVEFDIPDQLTLGELLEILSKKYGKGLSEHFDKIDYLMIFVNNVEYRTISGMSTRLKDGDHVTFGHILAGGSC
jgi:MoaD family protein